MFDVDYLFDTTNFNGVVLLLNDDLKIVRVNDYFLTLQGYEKEDVEYVSILDFILPTDKSIFFDISYSKEITKDFICQIYHKNGAFRFFSFTVIKFSDYSVMFGSPEKKEFMSYHYDNKVKTNLDEEVVLANLLDITDLFKENKTMGRFMDLFPSDIWVKDRLGRYVYVNSTFEVHTSNLLSDIIGKDDYQIFPKDIALEFSSSDQIAIKNRKKIDYTFEVKDESLLAWTSVSKIPLFNSNGTYIGIIGYSVDVSEFKNVEEKLKIIINNYRTCANEYFDIAFNFSSSGQVGKLYGKDITEDNLSEFKVEIVSVFDPKSNSLVSDCLLTLNAQKQVSSKISILGNNYTFTFIKVDENQEYNVNVFGKRLEE